MYVIIRLKDMFGGGKMKRKIITVTALFLVFASVVTLFAVIIAQKPEFKNKSAQKVYIDGVCSVEGGEWEKTIPEKMTDVRFHNATIRGSLSEPIKQGQKLVIISTNIWYKLESDGFSDSNRRQDDGSPLKDTPGTSIKYFDPESLGDEVTLELYYPYTPFSNRDLSDLINIYIADDNGVYALIINNLFLLLITAIIISSFGLFVFPIAGVVLGGINMRYFAFSVLSFVTGIHLIFKILYPYLPLWIDDPVLCMTLGESTIHIFCLCVLLFIKATLKNPKHGFISDIVLAGYTFVVALIIVFSLIGFQDMYSCKPISHAAFTIGSVILCVCMSREIKTNKDAKHALFTLIPITAALVFDALNAYIGFANFTLLELGTVLALVYQIVNLVIDMRRQYKEAIHYQQIQKELYESRVAIMVSQIQPHFLYNSLSSIAMMCTIDPETAREATVTFADYLRGNMDSLKQKTPVPFEKELEHLKKYLYIEKLRFGKKLNIVYDIQTDKFVLPQLSVQPLVENAVKHGISRKRGGGTLTIATRETEDSFEVIVSDDGNGFDTNEVKNDGRSHIGMDNVRRRIKEMCGGTVKIESKIGEGTVATVTLPKEGQNNEDPVR